MRGKHSIKRKRNEIFRITPAHAGKTLCKGETLRDKEDHPRACGENDTADNFICLGQGSPPRMRGKLHHLLDVSSDGRITPAHAGKTHKEGEKNMIIEDHPRACGENNESAGEQLGDTGSPPRMRGKR